MNPADLRPVHARQRAIVRLADGRVGVLVFFPSLKWADSRSPRVMVGGARSTPVPADRIVEVLDECPRRAS